MPSAFPHLPPELITIIVTFAGPAACVALRDAAGLQKYLHSRGGCMTREEERLVTDACVQQRWSAGVDLLVKTGVFAVIKVWPTHRHPGKARELQSPAAHHDASYVLQRKRLARLSVAPGTIQLIWKHVRTSTSTMTMTTQHLDLLAILAVNATTSDSVVEWCCQRDPGFIVWLGRRLVEQGKGVDEFRALCGLYGDDAWLANSFIDVAASHGRLDLLRLFDAWCPHLAEERTSLLCSAAAGGSAPTVRFLLGRLIDKDFDQAVLAAVASGKLEVVQELAAQPNFTIHFRHIHCAIEYDRVHILRWMHSTGNLRGAAKPARLLYPAVNAGAVRTVHWLSDQFGLNFTHGVQYGCLRPSRWLRQSSITVEAAKMVRQAVAAHSLGLIEWLAQVAPAAFNADFLPEALDDMARDPTPEAFAVVRWFAERSTITYRPTSGDVDALVRHDQLDLLRSICRNASRTFKAANMQLAVRHSSMELIRWLGAKTPACEYTPEMLTVAASRGSVELVQWVLARLPPHGRVLEGALDAAAAGGHLQMVRYLHERFPHAPATTQAMDQAAAGGFIDVVRYLHTHRSEGCTTYAMDQAAAGGFIDVVRYLHTHRSEGCTTYAMDAAAAAGMLHIVQWLHENRQEGCTTAAMRQAAANGWLHVVKYLHSHRAEGCTDHTLDRVARGGDLTMLSWYYENRQERCSDAGIEAAAAHGHFAVLRFLLQHHTTSVSTTLLAKTKQHPQMVEWLCKQYGESRSNTMSSAACKIQADGKTFDLTALQRSTSDYFAASPSDHQFYFNLCQATVEPKCKQAAACITSRANSSDPATWKSVGTVASAKLEYDSEDKLLVYTVSGGDACPDRPSDTMSMQIDFTCLPGSQSAAKDNATAIGFPTFAAEQDKCRYVLRWKSKYGCPIGSSAEDDSSAPSDVVQATSCSYTSAAERYDLSPLKRAQEGQNWQVQSTPDSGINDLYLINVCAPLTKSNLNQCPDGTSVCAINQGNTAEKPRKLGSDAGATTVLTDDGVLQLTYSDGDPCPDGTPRTTAIRFPCNWGTLGTPRLVEGHTACGRTIFEWESRVGCNLLNAGPGALAITFWVLFSLSLAYCIGATLIRRYRYGYPGIEAVPHLDRLVDIVERGRALLRRDGRIRI
ncbi:Cation-independent mannose-6-phosphate receptor [Sorochytrium milnesiophthora]